MRNHVLCSLILGLIAGSVATASAQTENSAEDTTDQAGPAQAAPAAIPAAQHTSDQELAEPAQELAEPAQELAEPAQELAEPAQEPAEPAQEPAEPAQEPAARMAEKQEGKKKDRDVDVGGRVFVRNTVVRDGWANRLSLDSARFKAVFRDRIYNLRVEIDIEAAEGDAEIRDAHVRWRANRHLRVQAGRFKRPVSAIALASRWDLPVIERGYLNELQFRSSFSDEPDELPLGGRATGVTVTLRDRKLPARPELVIGVFRSPVHEQIATSGILGADRSPLSWSKQFPEDVFARLEVEPAPWVKLATSLAWVGQLDSAGDKSTFRHGYLASIDATVEAGPLRGWLEGFMGTSPLHLSGGREARGRFMAARAIASGRWLLTELLYLEPYATIQFLDSSDDLEDDRIVQGGGGVNLGIGETWRVQTGVDHASVDSLLLYDSSTLFLVQLGAVF